MGLKSRRVLAAVISLNGAIIVAEVAFSKISGSVALLSDALHNTGDMSALLLAMAAATVAERRASWKKTFGYRRAEVIAAELNSLLIMGLAFYIVYESVDRLIHPSEVNGTIVMAVAAIALAANLLSATLLRRGAKENINQRGAYLHMLADAGTSFAVLFGGFFTRIFGLYEIDPLVGLFVSAVIFYGGYGLLKDSLHILMEGAPEVDVERIRRKVLQVKGVWDIHTIRCWKVSDEDTYFTGHLVVDPCPLEEAAALRREVERVIKAEGINNVTLQVEIPGEELSCGEGNVL